MIHCTSRFVDLTDKVGGATSITYVTLLDQQYNFRLAAHAHSTNGHFAACFLDQQRRVLERRLTVIT